MSKEFYKKGRHIKEEKENRDTACQKHFGKNYHYDPSIQFSKFKTISEFKR